MFKYDYILKVTLCFKNDYTSTSLCAVFYFSFSNLTYSKKLRINWCDDISDVTELN